MGTYEDEVLSAHGFGITDVVKVPRDFGSEPDANEYGEGWPGFGELFERLKPDVTFWPYKGALDKVIRTRSASGQGDLRLQSAAEPHVGSSVFVFGMMGTPCSAEDGFAGCGRSVVGSGAHERDRSAIRAIRRRTVALFGRCQSMAI